MADVSGNDVAAQLLSRVKHALGFVDNSRVVQIQAEVAADGGEYDAVGGHDILDFADLLLCHILCGKFTAGEILLNAADAQLRRFRDAARKIEAKGVGYETEFHSCLIPFFT